MDDYTINLDGMTREELDEIYPRLQALASYAFHKARAMTHRERGRIEMALDDEAKCDAIHRSLPDGWRW